VADDAGEERRDALVQLGLPPRLVEEGELELARAVGDRDAREVARPAARVALQVARLDAAHLRDDRDVLAGHEAPQLGELAALRVAARQVPEQVADRLEAERAMQLPGLRLPEQPLE